MSAFTRAAPGKVPTHGASVSSRDLFTDHGMLARCQRLIAGTQEGEIFAAMSGKIKVSKYKVEIFDLSDAEQREAYEKLWLELFEMVSRGEAFVDARKDLVHRADGTSYWMKYIEYAIIEPGPTEAKRDAKEKGDANG